MTEEVGASPIPPNTAIFVGITDENDPESPLEAYLVSEDSQNFEDWTLIASSFGAEREQFLWVIGSLGQYHNLIVEHGDGVLEP